MRVNSAMSAAGLVLALILIPLALLLAHRWRRRREIRKQDARRSLIALSKLGTGPDLRLVPDYETPRPALRSRWVPKRMDLISLGFVVTALVSILVVGFTSPTSSAGPAAKSADPVVATLSVSVESQHQAQVPSGSPSSASKTAAAPLASTRTVAPATNAPVKPIQEKTVVVTTTVPAAPAPAPQPQPLPAQAAPVQQAPVPAAGSGTPPLQDPAQGQKKDASKSVLGAVGSAVSGLIVPIVGLL
jgi:hypothetical protein